MEGQSVFFISGGGSGIGAAIGKLVVERGHRAVLADINLDAAAAVEESLGTDARAVRLDVRKNTHWESALDAAYDRFGKVDILVNNAGVDHVGWTRDLTDDQLREMIDVNLLGLVYGVRATLPRMEAAGAGHVINIGSLASFIALPGQAVYSATKHAVRAFHHAVALESQKSPVTFSLVCPGAVDTPMLQQQVGDDAATLSFANPAITPAAVAEAVWTAAESRPPEVLVPSGRGEIARFTGVYPKMLRRIIRMADRRGRKAMKRLTNGK